MHSSSKAALHNAHRPGRQCIAYQLNTLSTSKVTGTSFDPGYWQNLQIRRPVSRVPQTSWDKVSQDVRQMALPWQEIQDRTNPEPPDLGKHVRKLAAPSGERLCKIMTYNRRCALCDQDSVLQYQGPLHFRPARRPAVPSADFAVLEIGGSLLEAPH